MIAQEQDNIRLKEKASYFIGNTSQMLMQGVVGTFLLLFYTDVVGLDPIAIGTLFVVSRLIDAVSDPISGYILDHLPRTKWGRFRPYLFVGGLLTAINFWLIFAGPAIANSGKIAIAWITYLTYGIVVDAVIVSLTSLIPAITQDDGERNVLATMRGIGMMVGFMVGGVATVPIVGSFTNERTGWLVVIGIYSVIVAIVCAVGALGVRERVQPVREESYQIKDFFRIVFNNRPLWLYVIHFLLWNIGFNALGTANAFYFKYNVGQEELIGPALMAQILPMIIGAMFVPRLCKRFDKKWVYIIGLAVMSFGALGRFFIPVENLPLIFISIVVSAIGGASTIPLPHALIADIVDYVEWKFDVRAEGVVTSFTSFLAKAGTGLGAALPAYILGLTGYVPDGVQSPAALTGILLASAVAPFAFGILGSLTFIPYSLTQIRLDEIKADLRERASQTA